MKVTFKKSSEVDFDKLFPVVDKQDYELLSGISINLTRADWDKVQKEGVYKLNGYQISKELMSCEDEGEVSRIQSDVQALVDKSFINAKKVVDIIFTGLETRKNVLLWGKGGHGKSEITSLIMKTLKDQGMLKAEPFVQVCGDGLTEEKLYGGMNIKKYKEEGVIEFLPENSFMNHKVVIFEEIFDAPPSVLLGLKDILTSGEFRQGNEKFKSKTKIVIALTNKSKDEFADQDDSLKALAERFPLTLNVKWDTYKRRDFLNLFKKVHGKEFYNEHLEKLRELASICEMNNAEGTSFISPRTAVTAATVYAKGKNLSYIADLDPDIIAKFKSEKRNTDLYTPQKALLNKIDNYIDNNNLKVNYSNNSDFMAEVMRIEEEMGKGKKEASDINIETKINKAQYLITLIDTQTPVQSLYSDFQSRREGINNLIKDLKKYDPVKKPANTEDQLGGTNTPF